MSDNFDHLKEKLRLAGERMKKSLLLEPGDYRFAITLAEIRHDNKRGYDYLYVKLLCDGKKASDRFPFDNMLEKLAELLKAVGMDIDSWHDPSELVGLSGQLTATPSGDKVFYNYLAPV
jgi:hypothetical protein